MKTIFIVDDEFGIVDALSELFREEGYGVVSAANGKVALKAMEELPPDIVLLDVMMPIMNGFETLRQMRERPALRAIPVIMMSAAPQKAAQQMAADVTDYAEYIRKPFVLRELRASIRRLIGPPG